MHAHMFEISRVSIEGSLGSVRHTLIKLTSKELVTGPSTGDGIANAMPASIELEGRPAEATCESVHEHIMCHAAHLF